MKRRQVIYGMISAWASAFLLPRRAKAQSAPEEAIQGFIEVSGGLLGLNFNELQRSEIRRYINTYWQQQDYEKMQTIENIVNYAAQLRQQPADLRAVALRMTRPDALVGLEQDRRNGDQLAVFLLDTYYRVHPILAPAKEGGLPLTRDTVDGQLDLQYFLATEIHRHAATPPDTKVRENAYRTAATHYENLSAQQQIEAARAPGEAARLRYGWSKASTQDRLLGRAELGASLTHQEQAEVQQILASFNAQLNNMAVQHQQSMLGSAIENMKQNSDMIMGRGTVWNPSTNRWEQQGGIVTDYNGTVSVP